MELSDIVHKGFSGVEAIAYHANPLNDVDSIRKLIAEGKDPLYAILYPSVKPLVRGVIAGGLAGYLVSGSVFGTLIGAFAGFVADTVQYGVRIDYSDISKLLA